MRNLGFWGFIVVCSFASVVLAEDAKETRQAPIINIQQAPPIVPRGQPIFDDKVFDVGKPTPEMPPSESPTTGIRRYRDTAPVNFNAAQREAWIRKCSVEKDPRKCFNEERQKNDASLVERQQVIEKRSTTPFQNLDNPTPDNQPPALDSGVTGVDVKESNLVK